jgi:hypothetical protein
MNLCASPPADPLPSLSGTCKEAMRGPNSLKVSGKTILGSGHPINSSEKTIHGFWPPSGVLYFFSNCHCFLDACSADMGHGLD